MPAVKYMYNHELFSTDTQRVCINQGCAKPNLGLAKLSGFGFVCPWSKWFLSWFQEKTDKGEKSLKNTEKNPKKSMDSHKKRRICLQKYRNQRFLCGFGFVRICPNSFVLCLPCFRHPWYQPDRTPL